MNSSEFPSLSRRSFLMSSAALCAAGATTPWTKVAAAQRSWQFEDLQPAPENTRWRLLDAHDTGYLLPERRRRTCGLDDRLEFDTSVENRPAFAHIVKKNQIVDPIGVDSARVIADFSSFDRVVLRYHHWVEKHSFIEGKWIGLQLGRGWVSRSHPREANALYGYDGCSATTMHPKRDGGNGIRMLVSHIDQQSIFGDLVGSGDTVLPTGRWMTMDIVIDKHNGYRLYVDGVRYAESSTWTPMKDWNSAGCIWYRTRLMHGGHPEDLPALHDYREFFGGYFIAVA